MYNKATTMMPGKSMVRHKFRPKMDENSNTSKCFKSAVYAGFM